MTRPQFEPQVTPRSSGTHPVPSILGTSSIPVARTDLGAWPITSSAGDHEALLLEALSQIPQPMSPEEVARLRTDFPPIAASDDPATFEYFPD